MKFIVPDNGNKYDKACLRVDIHSNGTKEYDYDYWDLKIEKGNKYTDWTPAPEDIDSDIQDVNEIASNAQSTANNALTELMVHIQK